jgi:hypothetical protein
MNIQIQGMQELQKALKNIPEQAKGAASKELRKITLDLKGKAQRIAPVAGMTISGYIGGDLVGTAFAEVEGLEGVVGFTSPYALRQHEEVGYRHETGKTAKFLETPYKENAGKYAEAIKDAVRKAVDP